MLATGLFFWFSNTAGAAAAVISSQDEIKDAISTLEFKDRSTIEGVFGGQRIKFVDVNPYDTEYNYVPSREFFCSSGDEISGITISSNAIAEFGKVASSAPAKIDLDYSPTGSNNKSNCKDTNPNALNGGVRTNGVAFSSLRWSNGALIENATGDKYIQLSQKAANFYVTSKSGNCFGDKVVVLENDNQSRIYWLHQGIGTGGKTGSSGTDASSDPLLQQYISKSGLCKIEKTFRSSVVGTRGSFVESGNGDPSEDDKDTSECLISGNTALEWVLCPIVTTLGKSAEGLNNIIEGQLFFNVDGNLADGDAVATAWAVIRAISTGILVIVMLVMVISQALGGSIFDAYTIRKMLPRLVVAVILIQISWDLSKFLITLANDVGLGLSQLMAAPFGGPGNLDLGSLLERLSNTWAGITTAATLLAFFLAAPVLAYLFLPGVAIIAFTVFISVCIALALLLFRNVLIVGCVLFAPIAFTAWVLPGTKKYWDMWRENFTKLLLLFPLIVAIIYTGRIFAWIVGDANNPFFIDYIMLLVGFFGPYFMIIRSFRWGGSLMAMAQKGIADSSLIKTGRSAGMAGLKEWDKYHRGKVSGQYNPDPNNPKLGITSRGPRVSFAGREFGVIPWLNGRIPERIGTRHLLPTNKGRAKAIQEYQTWKKERDDEAAAYVTRMGEMADKGQIPVTAHSLDVNEDGTPKMITGPDGVERPAVKSKLLEGGVAAQKHMYTQLMADPDERIAGQAVEAFIRTSSWPEAQSAVIPVDASIVPALEARGAEVHVDGNGNYFVRPHEYPAWEKKVDTSRELYPLVNSNRQDMASHILQSGRSSRDNDLATPAERIVFTLKEYISQGNLPSQAQGLIQEIARVNDPNASYEFAKILAAIAKGGMGSVNTLTALASNEGTARDINNALRAGGQGWTIEKFIDHANAGGGTIPEFTKLNDQDVQGPPTGYSKPDENGEGSSPGRDSGGPSGPPRPRGGSGGSGGGNVSTGGGNPNVIYEPTPKGSANMGPVELKIDHDALAETIAKGAKKGVQEGFKKAGFKPGDEIQPTVLPPDEEESQPQS